MMSKGYQRRHLRAPFKEVVLFGDQGHVFQASTVNISEAGILIDELPAFPAKDIVPMLIAVPMIPSFRNFSLLKMQTFSKELLQKSIIRVQARMVRREELSMNLDNIFRSRFGLEFTKISAQDQKTLDEYVSTFASNLIYLQTLVDSFNADEDSRLRTRILGSLLGYKEIEKIASLRQLVSEDYRSLQWL